MAAETVYCGNSGVGCGRSGMAVAAGMSTNQRGQRRRWGPWQPGGVPDSIWASPKEGGDGGVGRGCLAVYGGNGGMGCLAAVADKRGKRRGESVCAQSISPSSR